MLSQQQHVFSHRHHQFQQNDPPWIHGQAGAHHHHHHHHHQQPPQPQHVNHMPHQQQHPQVQAAGALGVTAPQNPYGRAAANSTASSTGNGYGPGHGAHSLSSDLGSGGGSLDGNFADEHKRLVNWVAELLNGGSREQALMELSKKREQVPELAMIIWHSFGESRTLWEPGAPLEDSIITGERISGVMTALLQEIISVYPLLNPSQLTAAASNRVCNALALLQCVASHNETRGLFLSGMSMMLEGFVLALGWVARSLRFRRY